jgi:hypothetical protein
MPQFVYKPEGATPKKWDFDPSKLMSPEAIAIERLTGMTFGEWQDALSRGSMLALQALLYVLLKRETPTLKFDDVQFCNDDVDVELTDEEAAEEVRDLEAKESLTDQEQAVLDALREQGHSAAGPKAPEPNSAPSTPSLSRIS